MRNKSYITLTLEVPEIFKMLDWELRYIGKVEVFTVRTYHALNIPLDAIPTVGIYTAATKARKYRNGRIFHCNKPCWAKVPKNTALYSEEFWKDQQAQLAHMKTMQLLEVT